MRVEATFLSIAQALPHGLSIRHAESRDQSGGRFLRRPRIRCQAILMSPARAIPATAGNRRVCGTTNAPVRKHAPKKNSHLIDGIASLPFRFGGSVRSIRHVER